MSNSSFDGYNSNNNNLHYNKKEEQSENWSQATMFLPLCLIVMALLAVIVYFNIMDLNLKYTGNAIEIDCTKGMTITGIYHERAVEVSYLNDNGRVKLTYLTDKGNSTSDMEVLSKGCAFKDNHNNVYLVDLSKALFSVNIDQKATVYYYSGDMPHARALTSIWVWIIGYGLLIPLLVFFVSCIYRNLHITKHPKL